MSVSSRACDLNNEARLQVTSFRASITTHQCNAVSDHTGARMAFLVGTPGAALLSGPDG
jgi:hypothetical protein